MPDSADTLPPDLTVQPPKPWLTWILLSLFGLGIGGWLAGPALVEKARQIYARRCAAIAEKHMEREDWQAAGRAIADARRWAPDQPEVLRLIASFLIKTRTDPNSLIYTLRRLDESGQATTEDRANMGQAYLAQNNIAAARAALARINETERTTRLPLELEAAILRQEGRTQESEVVLRRALLLAADDPSARLRLALLDHHAAFPELRQRARRTLWDLAGGHDKIALSAIEFLANNPELTSSETAQLSQLVAAHPNPTESARFRVASALLRLRPHARAEVVDAEVARYAGKSPSDLPALVNWLNQEREHERVLQLLPDKLAFKSAELLQGHLGALGGLGRWAEVQQILSKRAGLPLSAAFISVWRADAYRHLDQDAARARQQLVTAYEASGRGKEGMAALRAAQLAEELGLWDIAARCYAGLADAQPQAEIQMLEMVREMSLRERDTTALIQAARRLAELRPANAAYADNLLYLRLITGEKIELTLQEVGSRPEAGNAPHALFHALAAYRIGDIVTMREHLPRIADPTSLPAGQRAVYAGLLSTSGQVGPAFEFAEKVPPALLLEEELRFLRRAR